MIEKITKKGLIKVCIILISIYSIGELAIYFLKCNETLMTHFFSLMELVIRRPLDREVWRERFISGLIFDRWTALFILFCIIVMFMLLLLSLLFDLVKKNSSFYSFIGWIKENETLRDTFIATAIMSIVINMCAYTKGAYLADNAAFYNNAFRLDFSGDKWLGFIFSIINMFYYSAWMSALWDIVIMTVAIYYLVKIFDLKRKLSIWAVAAICITSPQMINQHSYCALPYVSATALFFACYATFLMLKKPYGNIRSWLFSLYMIAFCGGIYGYFFSVIPTVIILITIYHVICCDEVIGIWKKTICYIVNYIAGLLLYYIIQISLLRVTGTSMAAHQGRNQLENPRNLISTLNYIPVAYKNYILFYLGTPKLMTVFGYILLWLLTGMIVLLAAYLIRKNAVNLKEKSLIILLVLSIGLLPLSTNLICVVSWGLDVKNNFSFAFYLPLVLLVKELETLTKDSDRWNKVISWMSWVFLVAYIYIGILQANAIFSNLGHLYDYSMSIATRIIDRIETYEEYEGDESIIIVGYINNDSYFRNNDMDNLDILNVTLGGMGPTTLHYNMNNGFFWGHECLKWFITYQLGYNNYIEEYDNARDLIDSKNLSEEEANIILGLDSFPKTNCMRKIGNTIYVRFLDKPNY